MAHLDLSAGSESVSDESEVGDAGDVLLDAGDACESPLMPLVKATGNADNNAQQRLYPLLFVVSNYRLRLLVLLVACCSVLLLLRHSIGSAYDSSLARSILPYTTVLPLSAQHLLWTLFPTRCVLPSSTSLPLSPELELSNELLSLLLPHEFASLANGSAPTPAAVTSRVDPPGKLSTVLSHIEMTSDLQLPAGVPLTILAMLSHDAAVMSSFQLNRLFVHPRQLSSPMSDPRLLKGDSVMMGVPSDSDEKLLPLHDACLGRRVLPTNPSLDMRHAPAYYDYSVSQAIDEACSAVRRPAVHVAWSDNLCHDDSVHVHSLHQRVTIASAGNRAGSMSFRVLGSEATHGTTGHVQRFLLVGENVRGDSIGLEPEFKGRLVGPAIVAVQRFTALNVSANSTRQLVAEALGSQVGGDCASILDQPLPYALVWLVEYEVFDSGLYMLELRMTWLKRAARWGGIYDVVERRPHALLHTVYRGVLDVKDAPGSPAADDRHSSTTAMQQQRLCGQHVAEHDVGRGRWLPLPSRPSTNGQTNATELYCDDIVCTGSNVHYLQDEHGFSIDYEQQWVWRPVACRLRLYSPDSFAQCMHRLNYSDIYFHGDSLAREQYQNTVMLLDRDGVIDLPKTQATAEQLIKKVDSSDGLSLHLRYNPDSNDTQPLRLHFIMQDPTLDAPDAVDGRRLLLWAPRLATGLHIERESWNKALSQFRKQLALQNRQCRDNHQLCHLLVQPTIQAQHKVIINDLWADQRAKNDYHCDLVRLKQGPTVRSVIEIVDELKGWLHSHGQQQPTANVTQQQQQVEVDRELFKMSAGEAATLTGAGLGMRILPADAITAARWDSSHDGLHYSALCDFFECHLPTGRGCTDAPPLKCPEEARPHYKRNWNGGVSNMITMTHINLLCND